jgi:hypothetical protein
MILFNSSTQLTILFLTASFSSPAVLQTPDFSISHCVIPSAEREAQKYFMKLLKKKSMSLFKRRYLPAHDVYA